MIQKIKNFILPPLKSNFNTFSTALLPSIIVGKVILAGYLSLFEASSPLPQLTSANGIECPPLLLLVLDLIMGGALFRLTKILSNSERAAYRCIHLWHLSPLVIFPGYLGYSTELLPLTTVTSALLAAIYGYYLVAAAFLGVSVVRLPHACIFLLPLLFAVTKDVQLNSFKKVLTVLGMILIGYGVFILAASAAVPPNVILNALLASLQNTPSASLLIKISLIVGITCLFFSEPPQQRERPTVALAALASLLLVDFSSPHPSEAIWVVPFWLTLTTTLHSSRTLISAFYLCSVIFLGCFIAVAEGALGASALQLAVAGFWGGVGAVVVSWIKGT